MIAVIDYGVGNLFSVEKALLYLGADVAVTNDAAVISQADKLIVPGVGAFGDCMKNLTATRLIPLILDRVHMGWNSLQVMEPRQTTDLFQGLPMDPFVYFVHSFHAVPKNPDIITAVTEYGERLTAAVAQDNVQATQFHPEKSGDVGLHILRNFVES